VLEAKKAAVFHPTRQMFPTPQAIIGIGGKLGRSG